MKIRSIKKNLTTKLSLLIAVALIATYFASFLNTRNQIKDVFDADLIKSSKLIFGILKHESFEKTGNNFSLNIDSELRQKILNRYEYKIHAQGWKSGSIIFNSGEAINLAEPNFTGFKDVILNDKKWRSFAFYDSQSQIKILVLEEYEIRNELGLEIVLSLLIPLLISFIPLFLIIIATIGNELEPLELLGAKIKKLSSKTLSEFKAPQAPKELQPFLDSFNALLLRLSDAIQSEQRFTDHAAHELNTPLAAIKLQAQFLATNKDKEKEQEYLRDLIEGVDRATHLVSQLLTLARLESSNNNFVKDKFDFAQTIKSVISTYEKDAQKKNLRINFTCNLQPHETMIEAARTYIEIMLGNLIDNALKYSFPNNGVNIVLTKEEDFLKLNIRNIGEEISPADIEKMFQNFYRVSKDSDDVKAVGSGLGLGIVKKIVDLHLGGISFASKAGINSVEIVLEP
jgi:two-component system sensor histidine kinase QseC